MRTRKTSFLVTVAVLMAIVFVGFDTASAQSGMAGVANAEQADASLLVENQNDHEVEVYAVTADGREHRLGMVRDRSSGSFALPETLTRDGQGFQLRINCVWPTDSQRSPTMTYHESVKTNQLTVPRGQVIRVHVREPLRDTFVDVGQS
jgi:hypothetical protein